MTYLHGTRDSYHHGCRCNKCREANNKYMRAYYKRNPTLNSTLLKRPRAKKLEKGICTYCGAKKIHTELSTRFCIDCLEKKRAEGFKQRSKEKDIKSSNKKTENKKPAKNTAAHKKSALVKDSGKTGKFDFLWNE